MKTIIFIFLLMMVAIALGAEAQNTLQEHTIITKEFSLEQFLGEFVTALQAPDAERIKQLIANNPNTAKKVQQWLTELGKATGKEAVQARQFAEIFGRFCSGDFSFILASLQEDGKQAFYKADYSTALERFQTGLSQARALDDKGYTGQFLNSLGIVYRNLKQYQQAVDYYEQALAIRRELGDRRGEGKTLNNLGVVYTFLEHYQQAMICYEQALAIHRELDDRQEEGKALANLGIVYRNLEQYQQAIDYSEQALVIHRELGDRLSEGNTQNNLGMAYLNLGQYEQALNSYEQALQVYRQLGNRDGESTALSNLGLVYNKLGQYEHALQYGEQALTILQQLGNQREEGNVLTNIGEIYNNLGEYEQAQQYYEQALTIARKIGDRQGEGKALGNIGAAYSSCGQYGQALEYYEQTLTIARELGDRGTEGTILGNMGIVYNYFGQYEQALGYYEQALSIHRELDNRQGEGGSLSGLGVVYSNLGQYKQALTYHKQALAIIQELGDQRFAAYILTNIGSVYHHLGQYNQALKYHEQALTMMQELGDRRGEGNVHSNIGLVYSAYGQYDRVLKHYEQTLRISQEIGNRWSEGKVLNNIGAIYLQLGQYEQALRLFEQALTIKQELGDRQGEGATLNNIGLVYDNLGQTEQALRYFEQVLTITRNNGNRWGESAALGNIGMIYAKLERYAQALRSYEQVLEIARELGDRRGEGAALGNLGLIYARFGQYQKAYLTLQDSFNIHKVLDTRANLWLAQSNLAVVEVQLNRSDSAIVHYEQAIDTIEQLRAGLTEKEHKLSFIQDKLAVYDELIDLLQDLHQQYPEKGYDRKALEIFERKQGRVFLEEMGQSGARLFAGLPEAFAQRELDLEVQLENVRKRLVDEHSKLLTEQNKELIQNLEEREKILLAEQITLQEQIKTDYPDYYALKYPQPASLGELQQNVLQPGELMLVYNVMGEKTCLWLIGQQEFEMHTIDIEEEELANKIAALRKTFYDEWVISRGLSTVNEQGQQGDPNKSPKVTSVRISYELYTLLIPEAVRPLVISPPAPLLQGEGRKTLNIVPTGPLYALPFEALVTSDVGRLSKSPSTTNDLESRSTFLIEDIPISYLSSASLLKTLRESQARRTSTARYPLLAFADPVYDPDPVPLRQFQDRLSQEGKRETSLRALRSQSYRDYFGEDFTELPETAEEARSIANLLKAPKKSDPLQLREKASRANVFEFNTRKRLDDYHYLLFAMHGVLPGEVDHVRQSALVLSDNFLTMADVFQLQLNARLVSLSACNTGRGTQMRGEGVVGLTRAFLYAGTPAVAVTLWSVETFSAKELDVGMFEHLKNGQLPVHALRSIKLQMLHGEKGDAYRHPYYWAPFVVFGNGQ